MPTINSLQMRTIETVLRMHGGYVLDFSNASFARFFEDHGVEIYADRFAVDGESKAKRLRAYLRTADPTSVARVLDDLLKHRLASPAHGVTEEEIQAYRSVINELACGMGTDADASTSEEAELLRAVFDPSLFEQLPIDAQLRQLLVQRMDEAGRCIESGAYLAAVILCGSVLEGLCLSVAQLDPQRMQRAYSSRFSKEAPHLERWSLIEFIEVMSASGMLTPTVKAFADSLRRFRNYVHPAEQLRRRFAPDRHAARIGYCVVLAAAESLLEVTWPTAADIG